MDRQDVYVALRTQINQFESEFISKKVDKEPFEPSRVKFKRCYDCIIALYIPSDVKTNENRSVYGDRNFAKFRGEKAWCICILNTNNGGLFERYQHIFYSFNANYFVPILYVANAFVVPDGFDRNVHTICGRGIHYFNHWIAAYFYDCFCYRPKSVEFSEDGQVRAFYEYNYRIGQPSAHEIEERLTSIIQEAEKKYSAIENQDKSL